MSNLDEPHIAQLNRLVTVADKIKAYLAKEKPMYDLADNLEYARELRADKIERYRQDRYNESKQGDTEFLDYLSSDDHQELLAVIHRHWRKLERCGLSPRNGGGYDDLLVRRDAVEAIDIAWDAAINKSIDWEIMRGHANEYEPSYDPTDERV